ncbi:hypothetical protein C0993_001317 [Termitomyces sp. T159_Od127]|nr:hypothetical protein C0993_001317 [Termitomyces sp. T159_Od127]
MRNQQLQFGSVPPRLKDAKYLEQPKLENLIDKCIANETWKELREHGLEFLETLKDVTDIEAECSWGVEYQGLASEALKETILSYARSRDPHFYAQIIPIVQSSGTRKSRMIDQLGKKLVVIPLNLRPLGKTGKPDVGHKLAAQLQYDCHHADRV